MNIAIFCPNWVGDLVMATPTLRAVRQKFPLSNITAILRPYLAEVLAGTNLVDNTLAYDPYGKSPDHRGRAFYRSLRRQPWELAILLPNSFRSAWWSRLSGARRRIGFNRNGRGWLLTDAVAPHAKGVPTPAIDEYLRLAEILGCTNLNREMELATTADDERRLRRFWQKQRSRGVLAKHVVCLNSGGAFGAAKHWPVESFALLARRLAGECDKQVLVLCGPAEREQARQIVEQAQHPQVVSLADEHPSLGLTKAAVRNSELLITTDSGPRHFAAPFQVPVVTLFGPTHIAWSETYYERGLHLQLDLECGPCQQRVCPLGHHRCMRELSPDWVFRAAVSMLERFPSGSRAA